MSVWHYLGILVLVLVALRAAFIKVIVYQHCRGLLFRNGLLTKTLAPGAHWIPRMNSRVQQIDIRLIVATVPNQEVLSADNVTIKVSLVAQYIVVDSVVAVTQVERYHDALYMTLQIGLRKLVAGQTIDELMANRQQVGAQLFELCAAPMREFGLELKAVDFKDMMFPGEMKKIFTQIVQAQKEGQATLEKARGETAALRHLANAAKLLEGNPALMQLRALQAVEAGKGNTLVLNGLEGVAVQQGRRGKAAEDSEG